MFESVPVWMWMVGFLAVLGPLVTVHELGHYLVGRWFGVHAEAFSIGFGKELAGWTDRRGTRWQISALPLGGFVRFKGDMDPASIPDRAALDAMPPGERRDSFQHQSLARRALIVAAGPATNLLVALLIFAGFAMAFGKAVPVDAEAQVTIAEFAELSPAREAGLEVGDRITAIDGEPVEEFRDILQAVALHPNRTIAMTVDRDGAEQTFPVPIASVQETDRFGNTSTIGRIGIAPVGTAEAHYEPVGPVEAVGIGARNIVELTDMMVTGIAQIFTGDRSVRELGGPVKIAKFSGEQLSLGWASFVWFAALISLNLAFINLLPIPALDGGHLAFYAAEAVRRKPVGPRGTELAYRTGIALVLTLMVFVTINDVVSLPVFGG